MKKEDKLYGTTATYLQDLQIDGKKISETYETDVDELAAIYSDPSKVPTQLNKDKKREIAALAQTYLQLRKENS